MTHDSHFIDVFYDTRFRCMVFFHDVHKVRCRMSRLFSDTHIREQPTISEAFSKKYLLCFFTPASQNMFSFRVTKIWLLALADPDSLELGVPAAHWNPDPKSLILDLTRKKNEWQFPLYSHFSELKTEYVEIPTHHVLSKNDVSNVFREYRDSGITWQNLLSGLVGTL